MSPCDFFLADEAATAALGAVLAKILSERGGGAVYLEGDLGAGKSSLARGFLRALGATGAIRSPTYTLLEPYVLGEHRALHMDLYRLTDPEELHQLGLSDYPPDSTLWLVEWPQRGTGILPTPEIVVRLAISGSGRAAHVVFPGDGGEALAAAFRAAVAGELKSLP